MIKKAFLILVSSAFVALGQFAVPAPTVLGNHEKDLVIKAFNDKTPAFIMKQFGRRLDFREEDRLGFPRWAYELDRKGGEELLTYKLVLLDKKWKVQNSKKVGGGWRRVFSFQAHFYRPIGNGKYICWDAFYRLLPTGVDHEKEIEKQDKEASARANSKPAARSRGGSLSALPHPGASVGMPAGAFSKTPSPRGSLNSKKVDSGGVLGVKHNMNNPARNGDGDGGGRPSIPSLPMPPSPVPMPPSPTPTPQAP
jgi:hypothetical protein